MVVIMVRPLDEPPLVISVTDVGNEGISHVTCVCNPQTGPGGIVNQGKEETR